MKTKTNIPILTLLGLFMMSCASSSQVGKTSSWSDEIYGSTSKPKTSQLAQNEVQSVTSEKKVNSNYANLEQKYSDVIEINMDSIKNDTVIYRAEDTNPYNRILSDSYQESYERRLRGLSDPYYRMESWSTYYSDDYWYAQSYDPYFYNVVVMGNQVWVEPRYISAMFGWPRTSFSFGFGFGWNYGYWNYNPWYWNYPYNYNYYGYNPWYNNSYWWGWNDGYWQGSANNITNNNYHYGKRTNYTTRRTDTGTGIGTINNGDQTVVSRRRDGNTTTSNPVVSTRRTQTRVAPTFESNRRRTDSNSGLSSTETGRTDVNTRRVSDRPSREIGVSEPTRRTYNQSNGRTRTSSDYSARRNEGSQDSNVSGTSRSNSSNRGATPTYNRPERVSSPTTSSSRSNDSYRQSGSDNRSSSSGSSYSGSSSRSSSSSSSSNSSSSSSSSSGSNSNTRRR